MIIDLQQFCAPETETRRYLRAPWSAGDYTYATDGHIMVRTPRRRDVFENPTAVNGASIFKIVQNAEYIPAPHVDLPRSGPCPTCKTVIALPKASVSFNGAPFNIKYIDLIYRLPTLEVASVASAGEPWAFRFEEGEGALMAMRVPFDVNFNVCLTNTEQTLLEAAAEKSA